MIRKVQTTEFTFVKSINIKFGLVYDWCLKVSDFETLTAYEEKVTSSVVRDALKSSVDSMSMYREGKHSTHEMEHKNRS